MTWAKAQARLAEAQERFAASVQDVRAAMAAEERAWTDDERDRLRRLLDERHERELDEWDAWRIAGPLGPYFRPHPEWPAAEWDALMAELSVPAPAPRGLLVSLDAASVDAVALRAAELERRHTGNETPSERKTKPGAKALGIPERELLWIVERRVTLGPKRATREWLAKQTDERIELDYVPRDRLTPLVDWVDKHPGAAETMLRLREIPAEFSAGKLGPIPPTV